MRSALIALTLSMTIAAAVRADSQAVPLTPDILFWSPEQQVYGYKNVEKVYPTRPLRPSSTPLKLHDAPSDLGALEFEIDGKTVTLDTYFEKFRHGGLIVIKDRKILYERYGLGNDETSRWISFSVAKSVSSMLIGAAIQDGYIESVDEPIVHYLPRLRGSAYAESTIKDVLQMASGVSWNEDYFDADSDVSKAGALNALQLIQYLNTLDVAAKPGEVFNYNTGETNLVGAIARAAIGNNLATYLEEKIWQPFGMEHLGSWTLDIVHRAELGGCCINATLRDYARIGLFAMQDGVLDDGTRVLPEGWMQASTSPSNGYEGYGYLWWLGPNGAYSARGIFGQMIWIHPPTQTIIVTHGAWPRAVGEDLGAARSAMVEAVHAAVR